MSGALAATDVAKLQTLRAQLDSLTESLLGFARGYGFQVCGEDSDARDARPRRTPAPTPRPPLPSPLAVITTALGTFFVVLTLLAIQVRNGRDPALGPGPVIPKTAQTTTKGGKATRLSRRPRS